MRTLAQKRANVAGAFAVQGQVQGKRLLIVDDLFDSGATLEEVTRIVRQAGALRINVLTVTRTIHADSQDRTMGRVHWFALSTIPGIGSVTAQRLIERCGSVEALFEAPDEELLRVSRVTPDTVARLKNVSWGALEAELASFAAEGIDLVTWDDAEYPANLRQVSDAPRLLFVRGEVRPADSLAVAIVGARHPSEESVRLAETLDRELGARGLTIVSGLAAGIDTAAHRGALGTESARTLAVLGSGLRAIHPRENLPLAEAISGRGALLSELHPLAPARGPTLMARDRILSGLSRAVIVVEAGEQSGSMDTAARARRQGRLLLAAPGSPGTDALLADGAELVTLRAADLDRLSQRLRALSHRDPPAQLSLWGG